MFFPLDCRLFLLYNKIGDVNGIGKNKYNKKIKSNDFSSII